MPERATEARKQAARAEAETREQQFRTLANSIPQLAWMADDEGYIFWYNDGWYDYTGTTLEEMEGWGWQKVHHPDEVDRVVGRIKVAFSTGEPWETPFRCVVRMANTDGFSLTLPLFLSRFPSRMPTEKSCVGSVLGGEVAITYEV